MQTDAVDAHGLAWHAPNRDAERFERRLRG
jgi:hypothetical protein